MSRRSTKATAEIFSYRSAKWRFRCLWLQARRIKEPPKRLLNIDIPTVPPPTPIPLKFFGFASKPGEPKKIFLQQGEDIFVAGEGEIVNRRYKVLRISPTSVEMQDVVGSGPPQNIPLTQG